MIFLTPIPSFAECWIVHLFYFRADLNSDLFLERKVKPNDLLVQLGVEDESLGELSRQFGPTVLSRLPLPPFAI